MNSSERNITLDQAQERLHSYLESRGVAPEDCRMLLAVSGGLDSMCMLFLMHAIKANFGVAHMNYGLRGESSDLDALLVREVCQVRGVQHFETSVALDVNNSTLQVAARDARYAWFEEIRAAGSYDVICTAHHQDDNLETFFINLMRGTGIKGLAGIPFRRGYIIRPMLCFSRSEIHALVIANNIPFREDASNAGDGYLRNRIRHHIVPLFQEEQINFTDIMRNNQERLTGESSLLQDYLEVLRGKLSSESRGVVQIDFDKLLKLPAADLVLLHLIGAYGFNRNQCQQIVQDKARTGARYLSDTHALVVTRDVFEVYAHDHFSHEQFEVQPGETIVLPGGQLSTAFVDQHAFTQEMNTEYVDPSKLGSPLILRHWKPGDYFVPLGNTGRQKLQDFFTNAKISPAEKAGSWILVSDNDIVWIVGLRLDERFKITPDTKRVMRLQWTPAT